MIRTVMDVDGMICGMCEAHIQDAVRKQFSVKKVTASRRKKQVEILSEEEPDADLLRKVIEETGYTPGQVSSAPYQKRGLFH